MAGPAPAETPGGVDETNMLPFSVATPADPVSKVLDDDNLLIEIIVRLGFPTTLVCAALVCKRWFFQASDPAFLRRFRKRNPPRLLGFYVNTDKELNLTRFVPMLPQPPELASVFRHASFSLDAYKNGRPYVLDCWKNNVLIRLECYDGSEGPTNVVHKPFFPERGMAVVPPSPQHQLSNDADIVIVDGHLIIKEGCDNLSYFYVFTETTQDQEGTYVYMFQDSGWCMITSATTEFPFELYPQQPLLVDNKIYLLASPSGILVFDLRTLCSSRIQLPQGVACDKHFFTTNPLGLKCGGRTMLSRADDDLGVYLIHVNEHQLVIWLHKVDNWLLVHTICLHEMCADLRISDCSLANGNIGYVEITMVGPNAEFVLLKTPLYILHWDIKHRTLRKVHEIPRNDRSLSLVHPFMMIWPPTFPALKDNPARASE